MSRRLARCLPTIVLCCLAAGLAASCHALTLREATDGLVRKLWEGNPPGDVIFKDDFEAGSLEAWRADPGWSVVERGDPPGKSAQVVSSQTPEDIQDLVLTKQIPVTPGHPIPVCLRALCLAVSAPL